MVTQVVSRKTLPVEIIEQLVDKTDGVPLYVEEMTKAVLESGTLKEVNGQYELVGSVSSLVIPATLQDSLMARLDRLVTAKAVAQYAAVIGRQFSYKLLQAVSGLNETMLQHELGRLVEAELVYQRGLPPQSTYIFKHALIQDTAYESLLRSTRQGSHRRIAEVLEERFPETAETQPELLAYHYTEANLNEQAIDYWYKAGKRASEHSAHVEAIGHFIKGLKLLETLPETPERHQRELDLQTSLGPALMVTKGRAAPEVAEVYSRARTLCHQLGDTRQLFPVMWGLWMLANGRAGFETARELGEQLLGMAQQVQDPILTLQAHHALGPTLFCLAELPLARCHLAQGTLLYYAHQPYVDRGLYGGHDPGACCHGFGAWTLTLLGYLDQALCQCNEDVVLAQNLSHPATLALAWYHKAMFHQFRREVQEVYESAEAVVAHSADQGFAQQVAIGTIFKGWTLVWQGQHQEGLVLLHQGLDAYRATGSEVWQSYFLALLAEVYGESGQTEVGLQVLSDAMTLVSKNGERFYEAEIHRLKGQLLLQQSPDNATEAESCFQQAISIAQNQSAKSWELRATTSLARLRQSQGKREEARELLKPVYEWFTEGFDTADLIDVKTLLEELK
jgi:predicted ATPase